MLAYTFIFIQEYKYIWNKAILNKKSSKWQLKIEKDY